MHLYPSSFTGKERDEETGYGYFGARYMDYELTTMWLSVDPMSDKYPSISPYAYCAWNPVITIDPNGMDTVRTPNGLANVGDGYKATPDGQYLYGDGLQTKRWNPILDIGGIVGDESYGGYENYTGPPIDFGVYSPDGQIPVSAASIVPPLSVPYNVFVTLGSFLSQVSTTIEEIAVATANVFCIIPACLLFSSDSRPNQELRGGHDNNARKSTKSKHEGGDRRRIQDQQGSKGEQMVKGKRPKGYKGPWPPKKKKKRSSIKYD